MKLSVNGAPVGDLEVIRRVGGKTLAMGEFEIAIMVDSNEDRTLPELYIDASKLFLFEGPNGRWLAGWHEEANSWCVWSEGAGLCYKQGLDREESISLAFELSYVLNGEHAVS